MITAGFMLSRTPAQLRAFATETFREADKDRSGGLDRLELYEALAHGRASISHATVGRLFELMDEDGDGTITEDEFVSGIAEFVLVCDDEKPTNSTRSRRLSVTYMPEVSPHLTARRSSLAGPASGTYARGTVSSQIKACGKRAGGAPQT